MPWASMGWEYYKSDMRWHFLLKYIQPQDITHLPAWIAIHTNELISGGKLLLPKWVGEETTLLLQAEGIHFFLHAFAVFSPFPNSATSQGYVQHLQTRPVSGELCDISLNTSTQPPNSRRGWRPVSLRRNSSKDAHAQGNT